MSVFVPAVLAVVNGFMAGFYLHSALLLADTPIWVAAVWGLGALLWVYATVTLAKTLYYQGRLDAYKEVSL